MLLRFVVKLQTGARSFRFGYRENLRQYVIKLRSLEVKTNRRNAFFSKQRLQMCMQAGEQRWTKLRAVNRSYVCPRYSRIDNVDRVLFQFWPIQIAQEEYRNPRPVGKTNLLSLVGHQIWLMVGSPRYWREPLISRSVIPNYSALGLNVITLKETQSNLVSFPGTRSVLHSYINV